MPELASIVGVSDWTEEVRAMIARVAGHHANVLIAGPTGTGKELIAQAIHRLSPRRKRPFVPVDCAAVSGALFASLMFGHVRGAFTGANQPATGCFRAADGGTLFLDEIGEMELPLQAKLLRALQERAVTPVGSHAEVHIDVRVLAASNRDLEDEVSAGRFREDLYYRLNVVTIRTVPLCDRPEDIEVLAGHFLEKIARRASTALKRLSSAALARLREHSWPGNVRELENVLERAALFSSGDEIDHDSLSLHGPLSLYDPLSLRERVRVRAEEPSTECEARGAVWPSLDEIERQHLLRTLQRCGHNQTAAAKMLGIDRFQLRRRLARHHIDPACLKPAALRKAA